MSNVGQPYGAGIVAPSDEIVRSLTEAHCIIWSQDDRQYGRAASILIRIMREAPVNHPIRVYCLKKLAKIARMEGDYALANRRLDSALRIARQQLGSGHPQTLRLLEKKAKVCEVAQAWYPKGHAKQGGLIPAHERKPLAPMVEAVYAEAIAAADLPDRPGLVELLQADMNFAMERYEEARRLYRLAETKLTLTMRELNIEHARQRARDCSDHCD